MFMNNTIFGVGFSQSYIRFNEYFPSSFIVEKLYSDALTPHTPYGLLLAEAGVFGAIALTILLSMVYRSISAANWSTSGYGNVSYFILVYFLLLSFLEPWPMISNFYILYIFYVALLYLTPETKPSRI